MKKYVMVIEIELDARDARDDVEARETARSQYVEMLGSRPDPSVKVKLQERFENKAPRSVVFNPCRS